MSSPPRRIAVQGGRSRGGPAVVAAALQAGLEVVDLSVGPEAVVDHRTRTADDARALSELLPSTVRRWVLASSAMVYGLHRAEPYREDDPVAPADPVGRGKVAAEEVGRAWASADPDRRFTALRLGLLEDPAAPPLTPLGGDPDLADKLLGGQPVPVPAPELDAPRLQLWPARDHGRLVVAVLADVDPPALLNAAAGTPLTWAGLMTLRAAQLGASPPRLQELNGEELDARTPPAAAPFLAGLRNPPVMDVSAMMRRYG